MRFGGLGGGIEDKFGDNGGGKPGKDSVVGNPGGISRVKVCTG